MGGKGEGIGIPSTTISLIYLPTHTQTFPFSQAFLFSQTISFPPHSRERHTHHPLRPTTHHRPRHTHRPLHLPPASIPPLGQTYTLAAPFSTPIATHDRSILPPPPSRHSLHPLRPPPSISRPSPPSSRHPPPLAASSRRPTLTPVHPACSSSSLTATPPSFRPRTTPTIFPYDLASTHARSPSRAYAQRLPPFSSPCSRSPLSKPLFLTSDHSQHHSSTTSSPQLQPLPTTTAPRPYPIWHAPTSTHTLARPPTAHPGYL